LNEELVTEYVYGLDLIEESDGGENEEFFGVDGLGSTVVLTDGEGNVLQTYEYDEFGELEDVAGELATDYLFAGEQFDEALGDYYLRQRFYDPSIGRFTRRDTYEGRLNEPITLNKFVYGHSNPVSYVDPSGLAASLSETSAAGYLGIILQQIRRAVVITNILTKGEPLSPLGGFGEDRQSLSSSPAPTRPDRSLLQRVLSFPGRNSGVRIDSSEFFPTNTWEDFIQHVFNINIDKTPEGWAEFDHDRIVERMRKEQSGFESGRHDQFSNAVRRELERLAKEADQRHDLPGYSKRLREIANTYKKRANGSGHKGGGRAGRGRR
ncbi:MAG: RHS repeat-associated core domain-containing protein, partial [Spirulina sp. SIO3F2]|nr:RHS repeat-associated core domain-containing protein [Spirulina sp. SIO3F2]